ncbi:MAG: hypothetical protein HQK49_01175 [Oligoflexia bacterium]|nr:hypothetical protein [Oligoflexia bacterium]
MKEMPITNNSKMIEIENENIRGLKNFRHSQDIENFYRFVHEHELRREAKIILDRIFAYTSKAKKKKKNKVSQ